MILDANIFVGMVSFHNYLFAVSENFHIDR